MLQARFQGSYEFKRICTEANIHFWACVLMQMVYTFIESRHAAESELSPAPANIPQFCYVAAAVCTTAKDNLVPYHSFMIEERIAIPEDAHFIKWIHNGSPNPVASIDQNHPEYDKAQFLSAAQHLQYVKTRGSAYVADFQGYGYQLTDAQIMTSPDLADQAGGKELFGNGNVPSAFDKFPHLHICNHWCHWLGLEPFPHNLEEGETL
ncbi:hypothetical protein CPB85DRAFT_1219719 [Mucidula mucida]|nr:hypothetical protein CPB85DRAFT_1219719 [Mucidula mucida]